MIELLPFDASRPVQGLRDGYYFQRQERGYGVQVTVVGKMPHTPQEFEDAVTRLMGRRYEITLATGYEAPEGTNEQEFLRRGYWRMVFFPTETVHRTESGSPRPRPRAAVMPGRLPRPRTTAQSREDAALTEAVRLNVIGNMQRANRVRLDAQYPASSTCARETVLSAALRRSDLAEHESVRILVSQVRTGDLVTEEWDYPNGWLTERRLAAIRNFASVGSVQAGQGQGNVRVVVLRHSPRPSYRTN